MRQGRDSRAPQVIARAREIFMLRYSLRLIPVLTLFLVLPLRLRAQERSADTRTIEEVRASIRRYDDALRHFDTAAVAQFWAPDYTFINPRGEMLTRADRLANLRAGRTAFDSLAPVLAEERIRTYSHKNVVAVHTTLLSIGGRYSGRTERGQYRATAIWVRHDGGWQQVASQLTPVTGP
jgi:ketosteroid isomerase-like protein